MIERGGDGEISMEGLCKKIFGCLNGCGDVVIDVDKEKVNQKSEYPIWDEVNVPNYRKFVGTSIVDSQHVLAPRIEPMGPRTYGMD